MIKNLLIISSFIGFIGCSGTLQYVNKDYYFDSDNVALSLIPLTKEKDALDITECKDVAKHIKADHRPPEDIILDSAYKYISMVLKDSLKKIECPLLNSSACAGWIQDSVHYFTVEKKVGNDSMLFTLNVLRKDILQTLSSQTNVGIIINKLTIAIDYGSAGSGFGGSSIPTLNGTVEFIIWDYQKNSIVSFGEFMSMAPWLFVITPNTYMELFKAIGRRLVEFAPYKVRTRKSEILEIKK